MIAARKSMKYRAITGFALAIAWAATLYGVLETTSVGLKLIYAASLLPSALFIHFIARVLDEGFGCKCDFAALDRLVREFTVAEIADIRADTRPQDVSGRAADIHVVKTRRAA